jgi:hypothetical protein
MRSRRWTPALTLENVVVLLPRHPVLPGPPDWFETKEAFVGYLRRSFRWSGLPV